MTRSRQVCPNCNDPLVVPDDIDHGDAQWLHDQRCTGLFPELSVVCPGCDGSLPVASGMSPVETVWMHELDCPAYVSELYSDAS